MHKIELLDVVELLVDIPSPPLVAGDVGTVVEILANGEALEIEFSNPDGRTHAFAAVTPDKVRRSLREQ